MGCFLWCYTWVCCNQAGHVNKNGFYTSLRGKLSKALNLIYLLKHVSCFNCGLRARTVVFEDRKAKMW